MSTSFIYNEHFLYKNSLATSLYKMIEGGRGRFKRIRSEGIHKFHIFT